ncbi:MAG TPA: 30S ribosomal protein S16, partial [Cyclobacteriaceae bacterium]|nr:30S ribosomal protein S16 [Cyclobacteriaceae bacterium]
NKAFDWLMKGAQPSDTVLAMLSYRGIMLRRHLQLGVAKGAITQEQADSKLTEWVKLKQEKIQSKIEGVAKAKQTAAKARKEAESKVKEARAEAIRKKAEVVAAPAETPAEETSAEPQA